MSKENDQELSVKEILSAIKRNMSSPSTDIQSGTWGDSTDEEDVLLLTDEVGDNDSSESDDTSSSTNIEQLNRSDRRIRGDGAILSESTIKQAETNLNRLFDLQDKSIGGDNGALDSSKFHNCSVNSMVKTALKEWMDSNLPQMIERVVEREIIQITSKYKN